MPLCSSGSAIAHNDSHTTPLVSLQHLGGKNESGYISYQGTMIEYSLRAFLPHTVDGWTLLDAVLDPSKAAALSSGPFFLFVVVVQPLLCVVVRL